MSRKNPTMASETSAAIAKPETCGTTHLSELNKTLGSKVQTQASNDATIESGVNGCAESTCNNNAAMETSGITSEGKLEKSLEFAEELIEQGSKAVEERDFEEATECFSRALEIRVAHYGELSLECVHAYYKYGCALLYKAQDEADPLVSVPKKEPESQQASNKNGSVKNIVNGESTASASNDGEQDGGPNKQEEAANDALTEKDEDDDSDMEDLAEAEADEDESDLDLAWKMLDVARAIVEKQAGDTMEKVDILSALAEVALEREDIESSLSDYLKGLSILERMVEPDSRHIAELNFRICLCLEIGSRAEEAVPYCQKAISVCKSRVERLKDEVKSSTESEPTSSSVSQSGDSGKEAEIETLTSLTGELEKKLEDLQQLVANPKSVLSEILGAVSAKAKNIEKLLSSAVISSSRIGTAGCDENRDSPAAQSNGAAAVTHLGIVGRGVKRVSVNSIDAESGQAKKPAVEPFSGQGEASAS